MKAIIFERFGEPADVLEVRDLPTPEPGPGQVLVRMIASPINPSDLLVVRGRYVKLPQPPATPGFEGVGVVEKAGRGLIGKAVVGKRVAVINDQGGNWAEYAVINARQARPVPDDLPDEQVASFFVNPATVLAMVRHVLNVPRGGWLLQSAANSSLGKMIVKLGKHDGFKTVNIVRRPESRAELQALGADVVLATSDGPIEERVRAAVGGPGVLHALDPVGGEIGSAVVRCVATGGHMLVYGSLSDEPLEIHSRALITGGQTIQGFWLGHFMRSRYIPQSLRLFREISHLIRAGVLVTEPGPRFPLTEINAAVRASETSTTPGKTLLSIS